MGKWNKMPIPETFGPIYYPILITIKESNAEYIFVMIKHIVLAHWKDPIGKLKLKFPDHRRSTIHWCIDKSFLIQNRSMDGESV